MSAEKSFRTKVHEINVQKKVLETVAKQEPRKKFSDELLENYTKEKGTGLVAWWSALANTILGPYGP